MNESTPFNLSPVMRKFILHWGEMGARWGINRTVAQIHALLYISQRPLNAEEIVEALGVARSNVSNSLRELQGWGIVRVVHVMGDRRDHFESMKDVWEMFLTVLDQRKRREIDPTVQILRDCLAESGSSKGADADDDAHARKRLADLLGFFQATTSWYEQMRRLPPAALIRFIKMGDKVRRLVGLS